MFTGTSDMLASSASAGLSMIHPPASGESGMRRDSTSA